MITNPATSVYKILNIDNVGAKTPTKKTSGLLSPQNKKREMSTMSQRQPLVSVVNHLMVLRNKRNEINGNKE